MSKPCVVLEAPEFPEVEWLECMKGHLCLETPDAREFTLWVLATLEYHEHIEEVCN